MVITDHINLMGTNPLMGPNESEFGPRFPDMKEVYDHKLIEKAFSIASKSGIYLQKGVYAGVTGPTFETPAEYRYMHVMVPIAVGMSTVPEVITARHMQIPVFALSIITDLGVVGNCVSDVSHQLVLEAANKAEPLMTKIIIEMLRQANL